MAKEFFELWRENSILKKIIAVLLIAGAVAASVASIFNLKDIFIDKKDLNTNKNGSNIYYNSGNGNIQQGGHDNTQGRDNTTGGRRNINIQSIEGGE